MCDGNTPLNGNRKPVTLVSTVVTRNTAVQVGIRSDLNSPYSTTKPVTIATRLIATCTMVNTASDIPKITTWPP